MRSISLTRWWEIVTQSIQNQELSDFSMATGGAPDAGSLIVTPDEKGLTVLHHLAKNANAFSVPALRHLITVAGKNGISQQDLLNKTDSSGSTALTLCVTSGDSSNLHARLLLILELLIQGADPTIGNSGTVLNRLSQGDKRTIQADVLLIQGVKDCNKRIQDFVLEQRRRSKVESAEKNLQTLSLACGTQQRKTLVETPEVVSPRIK